MVCWKLQGTNLFYLLICPRYLEIEERYVYCTEDVYIMTPEKAVELCDENTIGICAILGSTVSYYPLLLSDLFPFDLLPPLVREI